MFNKEKENVIKEKYKRVQIKLEPWPYSFSSTKKILKRQRTETGKVTYTVCFKDGQTRKVSADLLNNINKELVERYELDIFNQKEENSRRITRSKKKQKVVTEPIRSASSSDYRDDNDDSDDNDDNNEDGEKDIHDFIMYSDEEEQQTPLATSRGRKIVKPRAYDRDFRTQLPQPKKPSKKAFEIPDYKDESFIKHHSLICFRCSRTGQINGLELVFIGTEEKRSRLLLCQTCSISAHNNCLPTTTSIDKTTGELKCAKCINNGTCFRCHKSILTKKSEYVAFRCMTCSRGFHHKCIVNAVSPALANEIKKHNITDLYQSGKCMECLIYANRTPQIIASERTLDDGRVECLIKWKGESYRHTNWILADWVSQVNPTLYRGYLKRKGKQGIPRVSEDWTVVDRILNVEWEDKPNQKVKRILAVYKDTEYGDAVWDEPPKEEETDIYPEYQTALKRYIQASKVKPPKNMYGLIESVRAAATAESYQRHEIKEQPDFVKGGTIMKHQMEALNWLMYQWEKKQSCILADDMGLGKTIQIITFLYCLFKKFSIYPFLVVVPNSTATNWIREFEKWAPEMTVAPYFGFNVARKLALHNEILDSHERIKCHVVVATYESIMESSPLHRLFWPVLIVDESQRLKSDESYLFKALSSCRVDHTVLLTGTPLQNNLRELFNIMNFIHPKAFQGSEAKDYEDMTASQVEELHSRLRPHFLRRTKEEVLKKLPPKYELIVPVSMTALQKEVYKQCLSREIYETLALANGHKRQKGLTHIFTNLRKNLNHPYLLDGVEKQQPTPELIQKTMIDACAKLKLFHQMFPKLKQKGHRILLFSTMTRALDIVEDYLTYEQIQYTRIDGSTRERDRVRSIDAFNAPDSKLDVFLLSTRAGGVGINLTTADTVIIWDSDFNPYADLQAISRAHRIGQTKMVLIYRFMTRLTVEEKVLQIGKKKMALEHVVVERMKADEEEKLEDVESILKFGTEALFADDDSKDIIYDDAAIDNLLDREQYRQVATEQQIKEIEESEGKSNENGNMNFSFAKVWQADGTIEELATEEDTGAEKKETDFWEKFLLEQQAAAEKKKEEKRIAEQNLGRGARKRANITYKEANIYKSSKMTDDEADTDFTFEEPLVIEAEEYSEESPTDRSKENVDANDLDGMSTSAEAKPAPGTRKPRKKYTKRMNKFKAQADPNAILQDPFASMPMPELPQQYKELKYRHLFEMSKPFLEGFCRFIDEECTSSQIVLQRFQAVKADMENRYRNEVNSYYQFELQNERYHEKVYGYTETMLNYFEKAKRETIEAGREDMIRYMDLGIYRHICQVNRKRIQRELELEEQRMLQNHAEVINKLKKEQQKQIDFVLEEQRKQKEALKATYMNRMPPDFIMPLPPVCPMNDPTKDGSQPVRNLQVASSSRQQPQMPADDIHQNHALQHTNVQLPPIQHSKLTQPTAQVQQPPVQVQQPPVQVQQPPAQVQPPLAQIQQPPVQVQQPPAQVQPPLAQIQQLDARTEKPKAHVETSASRLGQTTLQPDNPTCFTMSKTMTVRFSEPLLPHTMHSVKAHEPQRSRPPQVEQSSQSSQPSQPSQPVQTPQPSPPPKIDQPLQQPNANQPPTISQVEQHPQSYLPQTVQHLHEKQTLRPSQLPQVTQAPQALQRQQEIPESSTNPLSSTSTFVASKKQEKKKKTQRPAHLVTKPLVLKQKIEL